MARRTATLLVAGFLVVLLAAAASLLDVPYVILQPGPTSNTLGSEGGKPLITIQGRATYPAKGHLDLTTVSVLGGPGQRLDLLTALKAWVDGSDAVVPEEQVFPKGQTAKQADEENTAEMNQSQQEATAAALHQLGIGYTSKVTVSEVAKGAPADGKLRRGDVVVSIDGTRIERGAQVRGLITKHKPGQTVRIVVQRAGAEVTETVGTKAGDDGKAIVGVLSSETFVFPFTVRISLNDVGGPSAGLMFALGIVDKLTPGDLTGGGYIAGTGTIDDAGNVGPIGGIQQKMRGARHAGATVFLAPADDCAEAKADTPQGLRLVKVDTLAQAVSALDAVRAGRVSGLPMC
jgi:PDZ domain-containing protein